MVIASNNAAFDLLHEDLLVCLLNPQYVLMYHMAEGEILAEQLVNDQVIDMSNTESIIINTLRDTQVLLPPGTVLYAY